MVEQRIITMNLRTYLLVENPRSPILYTLPKIHKNPVHPLGRPIVSSVGAIFNPMAIMLDRILGPLIQKVSSYVRDTGHFLELLQAISKDIEGNVVLAKLDVASLYTSMPHREGIEACEWLLKKEANYSPQQVGFFVQMLDIISSCNYFT